MFKFSTDLVWKFINTSREINNDCLTQFGEKSQQFINKFE